MTTKRLPIQLELDLPEPGRGEAPRPGPAEAETAMAALGNESPAWADRLMEAICDMENVETAAQAVMRNKGAPGIDGMTVKQLPAVLEERWPQIARELVEGRYRPQPVRRVRIPKPDGGERMLGIPTVIDRMIQQAILQRLQPEWDGQDDRSPSRGCRADGGGDVQAPTEPGRRHSGAGGGRRDDDQRHGEPGAARVSRRSRRQWLSHAGMIAASNSSMPSTVSSPSNWSGSTRFWSQNRSAPSAPIRA